MKRRDIAILAVGDKKDYDSYRKFHKGRRFFLEKGFEYVTVDYKRVLQKRIPDIEAKNVIVFLFFPFYYWDKYIEHRHYKGIYGNLRFYNKFGVFSKKLRRIIVKELADKRLFFVNHPKACALYRDKLTVKKRLLKRGIPTPKTYHINHIRDMQRMLDRGHTFFVKPRCGSMGKGITFLSWPEWQTNFVFKNNKIISRRADKGWKFREVTNNRPFLRRLLAKDVMVEKAIDSLVLERHKVDMRIYTFFNEALYIYPRKNRSDRITTNITQGGKGDPRLIKVLPKRLLYRAKEAAQRTSKALGLNLAGIDIVLDHNLKDVYVVDINAFPGLPKRRTFNMTAHMAKNLTILVNKGKIRFKNPAEL